jgi:hypothetical protein
MRFDNRNVLVIAATATGIFFPILIKRIADRFEKAWLRSDDRYNRDRSVHQAQEAEVRRANAAA